MADAETLLMETSDQNGNEDENGQNGAEQELMVGEDSQDNGTDGGKIDASKGEEDAGWVFVMPMKTVLMFLVVFFGLFFLVLVFLTTEFLCLQENVCWWSELGNK